jgi:rRNA maturation protein Nop10
MQSPYTIQFVATIRLQLNPISLHKSVCGHHTTSAQPNLPKQFSLWPQHCPSTTKSPYTIEFLANTLPQKIPNSLHIHYVATTLPQQNPISLHINSVCGHHTSSAQPNRHTQFSLRPTHCLSTFQSPYTNLFVATTLPQHIPISLHIYSVCGQHTASAHPNLPTH